EAALTHRSYRYEQNAINTDNQRLEFLGDAALGLISASYLYHRYPQVQEGQLTQMRSRITNRNALAVIGGKLRLGNYLLLGKGEQTSGGDRRISNIGDALEAVLGAVYLDGGITGVKLMFEKHFIPYLEELLSDSTIDNPKGALQELVQKAGNSSPRYRTVQEEGPAHSKTFMVEVLIDGKVMGNGSGPNKQAAEIDAAKEAIETLRRG
ncbi:MAG: ribonuclease III, partial [Verrucomicrobiota bacterium]